MSTTSKQNLHWSSWISYAALLWSLVYGLLGLYWAFGGAGFPFGLEHDRGARLSVLEHVKVETGAPVIAILGFVGALIAFVMLRTQKRGLLRGLLLSFAWLAAITLTLVIPDYRVLVAVAYAPLFFIGAPFGWPPVSFFRVIPWPVINQFVCIIGGLAWAGTAVAYARRSVGACIYCGRTDHVAKWTTPASASRWGKWAVYVAVVIPVLYALTRWAWALGIPLGIPESFLREGQKVGLWWAGAGLATLAVAGAMLTLGLIQPWGETFPRWLPFLAGKRVPIMLAVVPASIVSVLVTTAGLMFVRMAFTGRLEEILGIGTLRGYWAAFAPELLWPLWGMALAAATLAYHYRRRGKCKYCGHG